ncbi:hypothetical protein PRIPAC_84329, partial [Pristionchus pacificus]|uniref:Uncharacterized protein n=1 Tax=Pristionchus pacificus TaxID=54126 RepID=A0A2A6BN00_PRIPA
TCGSLQKVLTNPPTSSTAPIAPQIAPTTRPEDFSGSGETANKIFHELLICVENSDNLPIAFSRSPNPGSCHIFPSLEPGSAHLIERERQLRDHWRVGGAGDGEFTVCNELGHHGRFDVDREVTRAVYLLDSARIVAAAQREVEAGLKMNPGQIQDLEIMPTSSDNTRSVISLLFTIFCTLYNEAYPISPDITGITEYSKHG